MTNEKCDVLLCYLHGNLCIWDLAWRLPATNIHKWSPI